MTASSGRGLRNVAEALGRFDLEQLKKMRNLAERHVSTALTETKGRQRLVASATPSQFIDTSWIDEFYALVSEGWDENYALITSLTSSNPIIYRTIIDQAIKDSTSSYYDVLNELISKNAFGPDAPPILGEFRQGNLVQYGDVRPLLVSAGGGSPDNYVNSLGGIATGPITRDILAENGEQLDGKKIWLYGAEDTPRRTFNGHLQMDGLVFEDWNDEGLEVSPQDDWLRTPYYFPGDHYGCACVVAPYIPNFGEDQYIETVDPYVVDDTFD